MNELRNSLLVEFKDKEFRDVYCGEFLNTSLATQIKVLREQRGLTQMELADVAKMKQSRIAALEDVNYASWTISTLKKLARAFDLALTVRFDSFGCKLDELLSFSRRALERTSFEYDPAFKDSSLEDTTFDGIPQTAYTGDFSPNGTVTTGGVPPAAVCSAPIWSSSNSTQIH